MIRDKLARRSLFLGFLAADRSCYLMFCFRYYGQFHDYTSKDLELQSWAKELSEGVGKVEKQIHVIYNVSVKKVFSLTKNSIAIAIKTELGRILFFTDTL